MDGSELKLDRTDGLATISLNRPSVGNAIDLQLAKALLQAALACAGDPSIRAVILRAEGRIFCAGGDVGSFHAAGDELPALLIEETSYLHAAVSHLARMNKPLITSVQGAAAGAGFGLAILGDIVIAARSARFSAAYTQVGLSPDGGMSWLLPRIVGLKRAQELILTNRGLTAEEAAHEGLVTMVCEDEVLEATTLDVGKRLAAGPSLALGRAKALLMDSLQNSLEDHLAREATLIVEGARSNDGRAGIAAFVDRRAPTFRGC